MNVRTIGIIGPGKLGIVLAQLAVKANYRVLMSGSEKDTHLPLTLSALVPLASAVSRQTLIKSTDIIILAIPLSKYRTIKSDELDDKLVVDAMNYWWEVDGEKNAVMSPHKSSSEQVQDYFKHARIVKALSHVGYHDLFDHASNANSKNRRAIAVAGDNVTDRAMVAHLIDDIGFTPVIVGDLSAGAALEPGNPAFGASLSKDELAAILSKPTTQ